MAFKKKAWKDRLVEYAGRRQLKRISGDPNETMVVDVTRNEGTISQAGDAFSAANMNDLEQRIGDAFADFAYDDDGIYGYRRKVNGADTVIPFRNVKFDIKQSVASNATNITARANYNYNAIVVTSYKGIVTSLTVNGVSIMEKVSSVDGFTIVFHNGNVNDTIFASRNSTYGDMFIYLLE